MYNKIIVPLGSLKAGYVQFRDHSHPLAYDDGSVYMHRHVASIKLNRWITTDEHVHHIDGDKLNNSEENLITVSSAEHARIHSPGNEYGPDERSLEEYDCVCCGSGFYPLKSSKTKKFCSHKCFGEYAVKNKELTKEVLDALIPTTSWRAIGLMFGYSDNGIKKRAISLGCNINKARYKHK
jgi:hypothetical protein